MILIETKQENSSSPSPLNLSNPKEESTISFGELLKGVKLKKDDKLIQNGALVLSLENEQKEPVSDQKAVKKQTLLSLLKVNDKEAVKMEPVELNPKIMDSMSTKEIKALIMGAKQYLKEKIVQSDAYKSAEIKELPKTLKGLSELAQKIGIDISKITIEEVQIKTALREIPRVKAQEALRSQIAQERGKSQAARTVQESEKAQNIVKGKELPEVHKEAKQSVAVKTDDKYQELGRMQEKKLEQTTEFKIPKETPLFKAQTQREHTTEQLVATKAFRVEEKTPKTRADETLKLLLRGEKVSQATPALTADFSVATARVIAPTATSEATKSLESLLHGENSEAPASSSKTDGLTSLKADSFEVKLNEAKQMIKYLSQDVKSAIEDYKSPFTRVKVQLNPQKLGEVDLTVVQRGKNLHINLSSNSVAINTLSMNANELRVQLNNNGINNASLNFNSQDSSNSQAGQQEQHRQKEQQAQDEYGYFYNEEHKEEILSSLEIVVPHYA